ncbi:MAG: SHOCT domain-containing protein [Euryarchaeota archaeon]|nr:SHOCT domain-containing protein [Euryarchaeota archaeon]
MRRLTLLTFGLLLLLLLLTWHYERGSAFLLCRAWGDFLTGAWGGGMAEMHMRHMGGYGFRGFGLAFWALVLAFLYLLLSDRRRSTAAIDELNARLARGEITREEYLEVRRLLEER